jgi:uncharacterized protein (TIRG00374 family)
VKVQAKAWGIAWRLGVCGLLLCWILHAIFTQEGRLALARQGLAWETLSHGQQWQAAWFHGPRELWRALCLVDPWALVASFGCMGLTILLGVLRWRRVLGVQGLELPFGRAGEISLVAHFFNSFLLGSTGGDLMKAYFAARETHHLKTEAVVTVFVDRLIGLFAMLFFASLMMIPNRALMAADRRLGVIALFILLMMLACGTVTGLAFWGGLSRRWPHARSWLRRLPRGDLLERSLDSCRRFGKEPAFLAQALTVSMAVNAAAVLQVMCLAWGMRLSISPLALFVIVPMIICISALPITPSGLGVRENLYVLMLATPEINVAATQALSLSLLAYAGSLLWSLIGGLVYASLKETHHLREISQTEPTVENAQGPPSGPYA